MDSFIKKSEQFNAKINIITVVGVKYSNVLAKSSDNHFVTLETSSGNIINVGIAVIREVTMAV